ncbi:MAG TPA: Cof-type HAD-IIB family hydrolase [Ruminococcaceae bacterium]|nr:Cof-type HAD-IIB family hydrolase [Oscillospiraceae bacterium]
MIKLIALDLDGTLMYTDHITVTDGNRQALKRAHDKGVKIAISTGRTLAIVGDICEQVPEIDYIIYSNGASVYDRNQKKNIYTRPMDYDTCAPMLKKCIEMSDFVEVYIDGTDYISKDKAESFGADFLPKEFAEKLAEQMTPVDDLMAVSQGKEIEKITVYIKDDEKRSELWNELKSRKELYVASSMPVSMEFTAQGVNKGTALDGMCKVLGITDENCMAFGDAGNDCEMLEFAKYSFAMANATQKCKKSAKYDTLSNAEDGVAHGINRFI